VRKSRGQRVESQKAIVDSNPTGFPNHRIILALDPRLLTLDLHTIRLRGPWQLEPISRFAARRDGGHEVEPDSLPSPARSTMPADWSDSLGPVFLGRVRYTRTFQKPTGLERGDKVWLVVEPPRSLGIVRLADRELGTVRFGGPDGRFEITSLLADRNTLEIIVDHPALDASGRPSGDSDMQPAGGLVGEVRLEIEALK
jgi:hypothetical protein